MKQGAPKHLALRVTSSQSTTQPKPSARRQDPAAQSSIPDLQARGGAGDAAGGAARAARDRTGGRRRARRGCCDRRTGGGGRGGGCTGARYAGRAPRRPRAVRSITNIMKPREGAHERQNSYRYFISTLTTANLIFVPVILICILSCSHAGTWPPRPRSGSATWARRARRAEQLHHWHLLKPLSIAFVQGRGSRGRGVAAQPGPCGRCSRAAAGGCAALAEPGRRAGRAGRPGGGAARCAGGGRSSCQGAPCLPSM